MNLIQEKNLDLERADRATESAILSLTATATALNNAYDAVWNLPDERLVNVLQSLLDGGKLINLLTIHENAANGLNAILASVGSDVRAKTGRARDFTINDGTISLSPLPDAGVEPEITETPVDTSTPVE